MQRQLTATKSMMQRLNVCSNKKNQHYEIKQNLKKERKKRRREAKEQEREKMLNAMKKKQKQEKRNAKGQSIPPEIKETADEKVVRLKETQTYDDDGAAMIAWLRKRVEKSSSKIISLAPDSYKEYVNNGPRLHWSLVVFTARGARYRYSLAQPTFVMEVDVQHNQEIFNAVSLSHAPVFLMVPPTTSSKAPKVKTLYKKLPDKFRLNAHNNIGIEDLRKFLSRHTKQEVELVEEIDYNVLFGWVILLGMIVAGIYYSGDKLFKLREFKLPYFGMAIVAYIWLMGGGMYNIIRGTAFSGNGNGLSAFFHPSNGTQYGAGGLIVGMLHFGVGAMVILMNTWALKAHQPEGSKRKSYREPRTPMQMIRELKPSPGLCLAGAVFLWYNLVMIYTMKNPSYRLGFVQP
eukprot:jgi/Bigna1/130476/aug1.11_g5184